MHHRTLGRTDVKLSEVALGTWGIGSGDYGPNPPGRLEEVVKRAVDQGITTFDLAPVWGEGAAERAVGELIEGRRDEMQLVTRGGARLVDGRLVRSYEPEALRADLEGSLERLRTDHVDVFLLHNPDEETLREQAWHETVEALKDEGKVRAWGISVGDADQARMAIAAGADAVCLVYNVLHSDDLHDLSSDLVIAGCGVLARSPLAHGLLSGRWAWDRRFGRGDHRRDRWSPDALRTRCQHVDALRYLVHGRVTSLAQASIRYVLANSVVTSALVGARTPGQVADAAACAEGPPYLPDEDLTRVAQILASVGA